MRSPSHRSSCLRFLILIAIVKLACASALAQAPADQFVIIALPDTQFYSQSYPQVFAANMQWVANNAATMNIKYVAGLGDIVETGNVATQWQSADSTVRILDQAGIPYGIAIGNHDYDVNAMDVSTRKTVNFNKYFGPSRYAGYSWYGSSNYPAGSNENFYTVININGVNYMFLYLEFYPREAALQWAASILQANQDKQVIVVTHGYGNSDNYRMGTCDISGPATYNVPQDNDGDMMWSKLISQYANIIMVLSGHMTNAGLQVDFGVNGNLVNQMMSAHYPNDPNGGNGYLRVYTITPSQNRIDVKTYSPYANLYKTDSTNQFSVSFQSPPMGTVAGQAKIRGRIRNSSCTAITGATASYKSDTNSGTVTVNSTGYYTATVPSPATYTVTAAANGYTSATATVPVQDGYAVPARFVLPAGSADFGSSSSPASESISPGQSTTYTATITGSNGFSGAVTLAASGLPNSATATFAPTSVSGSGTATLTLATTSSTPTGTYPITITASSGTLQHSTQVNLVVNQAVADFSMTVSPASQTLIIGGSTTYSASVSAINGFSGTVALAASGLPTGAAASFSPTSVSGSTASTMTVTTSASTPAGTYHVTITGTSGSLQHTVQTTLVVSASSDFNFAASPASQTVSPNGSTTFTSTVNAVGGFTGAVTFAASGLPAGATASFSPTSVSGSGSSTLTVATTASTPVGTYPITITATSGSLQHTAQVTLIVNATGTGDFSLTETPAAQTISQNAYTTYKATVAALSGFKGVVTFAASGLPTGATATFSPSSITASGTTTLTVSCTGTAAPGNYTVTITATSGSTLHTVTTNLAITGFTLTVSPSSQKVTGGSAVNYTTTVTALNGFNATEAMSVTGLPTGATATFTPGSITGSGSSTMMVATTTATPKGTYTLTIKATATTGSLYHTVTVPVTVQ
jgi:uncharacterized membrane protein